MFIVFHIGLYFVIERGGGALFTHLSKSIFDQNRNLYTIILQGIDVSDTVIFTKCNYFFVIIIFFLFMINDTSECVKYVTVYGCHIPNDHFTDISG